MTREVRNQRFLGPVAGTAIHAGAGFAAAFAFAGGLAVLAALIAFLVRRVG